MFNMGENKGTGDAGASPGRYFILGEAECSEDSSNDGGSLEQIFSGDTESSAGDFIDNSPVDEGTSAELYHRQETEDSDRLLQVLKRKFIHSTPQRSNRETDLPISPILAACSITPRKGEQVKKKIRFGEESEDEISNAPARDTLDDQVEGPREGSIREDPEGAADDASQVEKANKGNALVGKPRTVDEVDRAAPPLEPTIVVVKPPSQFSQKKPIPEIISNGTEVPTAMVPEAVPEPPKQPEAPRPTAPVAQESQGATARAKFDQSVFIQTLLKSTNAKARVLAKAKEAYDCSIPQLTRVFKSNKTTSHDWVVCVIGVREELAKTAHDQLQQHCERVYTRLSWSGDTPTVLQLVSFKHQKNRDALHNLYKTLMLADPAQIICNPPRTGSTAAALYWYRGATSNCVHIHGDLPGWVLNQTEIAHQQAGEHPFELSRMVQWAYDNDYMDESQIALEYALMADEEENAKAFLKSNHQAKYVHDCAKMVRLYRRGEMMRMSMAEWIKYRGRKVADDDGYGWRRVLLFLRHQGVEIMPFLVAFKNLMHGVPKKNCICFEGPPNTGKSLFAFSLIKFLGGKVLSFANHHSHFWLQPLCEAKIALIDDCTYPFWVYCDTYLRNGLDGNLLSIDCKHKTPVQLKFPPLLITTNVYIAEDPKWAYLTSRIKIIKFPTVLQRVSGTHLQLTDKDWKSFFDHYKVHLDLTVEDDSEDGTTNGTLRISSRQDF